MNSFGQKFTSTTCATQGARRSHRRSPRSLRSPRALPARGARVTRMPAFPPPGDRAPLKPTGEISLARRRKRAAPQLTNTPGVMEAHPVMVARRPPHCLLSPTNQATMPSTSSAVRRCETRQAPAGRQIRVLLQPQVVARFQAPRLQRQPVEPLGRRDRLRQTHQGGYRLHPRTEPRFLVVRRFQGGSLSRATLPNRQHAIFVYSLDDAKTTAGLPDWA